MRLLWEALLIKCHRTAEEPNYAIRHSILFQKKCYCLYSMTTTFNKIPKKGFLKLTAHTGAVLLILGIPSLYFTIWYTVPEFNKKFCSLLSPTILRRCLYKD